MKGRQRSPPRRQRRLAGDEDDLFTSRLYAAVRPFEVDAEKLMSLAGPFFDLSNPENPMEGLVYTGPDDPDTRALLYRVLLSVSSSVSGRPQGEVISPMFSLRAAPQLPKRSLQEPLPVQSSINGTSPVGYFEALLPSATLMRTEATISPQVPMGSGERNAAVGNRASEIRKQW